jgi:hypothetical protein
VWERAQVEIIGGEIVRPAIDRAGDLGGFQRRLDDTSDADSGEGGPRVNAMAAKESPPGSTGCPHPYDAPG